MPPKALTAGLVCWSSPQRALPGGKRIQEEGSSREERDVQEDVERLLEECDSLACVTGDHKATVQIMPSPKGNSPPGPPEGSLSFLNDSEILLKKSVSGLSNSPAPLFRERPSLRRKMSSTSSGSHSRGPGSSPAVEFVLCKQEDPSSITRRSISNPRAKEAEVGILTHCLLSHCLFSCNSK